MDPALLGKKDEDMSLLSELPIPKVRCVCILPGGRGQRPEQVPRARDPSDRSCEYRLTKGANMLRTTRSLCVARYIFTFSTSALAGADGLPRELDVPHGSCIFRWGS